ncbi:Rieske 2Fe-2S domain-containing protein [Novosphingobium profundi]|uniref:anthranilate 1,2-dioxygenase large subunit AndAc n=1 Tax=Novosphingobium profundi TaxID=1774954 RepID=UPI001BD9BE59|nr:anthranilate 1,2-dioxygenase large subunit AndAc [Novosphingobium profundi]MBT0667422.1 Rieske 2Fe-2S domain-containing protein [Novosphingobium profundi]
MIDEVFNPQELVSTDGSQVAYEVFSSQEIYDLEQERIFRGPVWNFLGLEAEIPNIGDFKSTFVGDTPVVMTRTEDGGLAAWVNRCAHRGAMVCRELRGNATSHNCVYHQWSFDTKGNLLGVPFRRGQKGQAGMPPEFKPSEHNLHQLRVESFRGLVFATFSAETVPLEEYIGTTMGGYIKRVFHKPVEYLGCTRQFANSNWKLYMENVKDPYHASLLHLFHTTFNIFRVGMKAHCETDENHGLHSIIMAIKENQDAEAGADYKEQKIRSYQEGFELEDDSILALIEEFEVVATNHIQPIFPQLVVQQIHNTLVARQLLPKGPDKFELVFHFFGYADDTPELRKLRIKQANLVGAAGYISMEDTEATELVQRGTVRDGAARSYINMAKHQDGQTDTLITEKLIRSFWTGYRNLMGEVATGAGA